MTLLWKLQITYLPKRFANLRAHKYSHHRRNKCGRWSYSLIDAFDDIIAVKSLIGSFPPPYELSADIPHKIIRVETNFRFASFPLIALFLEK